MRFATRILGGGDCALSAKNILNLKITTHTRASEGFVSWMATIWNLRQVVTQVTAASWVTKLAQCLGFDLPNALPRNLKILADFF